MTVKTFPIIWVGLLQLSANDHVDGEFDTRW